MLWNKYQVTKLICGILFFLISVNLTSADRKRTVADPVSNFFSELGDLFLDVDRAIAVQTQPKVQQEDRVVSQILRPLNRFQKNYRNIQARLGNLFGEALRSRRILGDTGRSGVGSSKRDLESKLEASTTAVPVTARRQTDPPEATGRDQIVETTEQPSSLTVRENECSTGPLSDPFLEHLRKQRCSRKERQKTEEEIRKAMEKLMEDTRRASELLLPLSSNALDQLSKDLVRRMGDIEAEESKPEGRIAGDIMFSGSTYDKRLREFLKTHGRWLLDNPLLNSWRQSSDPTDDSTEATPEYSTEESQTTVDSQEATGNKATETPVSTSTEFQKILPKSGKSFEDGPLPPQSAKYYTITNKDGEIVGEEIDVVLEPQSDYYDSQETEEEEEEEEMEPQETLILAFTPDGVPLKLRVGPEIDNPIKYLHKVLRSAGVSLNIPVESYEDLEPVGKEVLRIGSGILMRAVYIDVSNTNELKSLLKTLMRSKASGKTKF